MISDLRTVREYNAAVRSVDLLTEATGGLGAQRRCHFHDGTDVREEVIGLDEGSRIRLALSEYSMPMKRLESELSLVPTADGGTEVTFAIHFEMKLGVLGSMFASAAVVPKLTKVTASALAGLDHHLRTGETVEPGSLAA